LDIQPKFYLWDDTTIYPMHALHPQLLFNAELSSLGYRAKAVSFYDSIQVTNNNNNPNCSKWIGCLSLPVALTITGANGANG
jgi:hypothetical protein